MSEALSQLFGVQPTAHRLPLDSILILLAHATLIGTLLMGLTWQVTRKTSAAPPPAGELITMASSVLFICIGMAVVMILVNDNLARAFAIAAAVALIRFRVKMQGKFIGMALLYGVLTGMACGLGSIDIAWILTVLFAVLLHAVLWLRRFVR